MSDGKEVGLNILVVEGDLVDRKLLERLLYKSSLNISQVQSASSLKEATALLDRFPFDIILSDLGLPDSTGMDTVNAIHHAAPTIPLIVLSGLDDESMAISAVKTGAQDYLIKGQVDSQVLVRAIRYGIERNRAERTLQEAEQKYRTIFENSAVAIMMLDETERLVSWNQFTERLLGMNHDDLHLREVRTLYPEEDWEAIRSFHVREQGKELHIETHMVKKGGDIIDVDVSVSVLRDQGDHVIGSVGVIRDITERKRAEEELDRSYSLLHATLESTADGLLALGKHGDITNYNQKFLDMWELSEDKLTPQGSQVILRTMAHKLADTQTLFNDIQQINAQPVCETTGVVELTNGRVYEHYSRPQYVANEVVGCVWSFRDITERIRVEEALRKSEERFRQVVEHAEEWIWEVDARGLFTYISPVVERILGFAPDDMTGKMYFYDLFNPGHREGLKKKAFEIFDRRDTFREFETKNVDKDGNVVWLSKSGVPLYDNNQQFIGYRGVDVDITERRRIHEILNRKQKNLESIFDAAPIGMLLVDEQIRVRRANDSIRNMSGKDYSEIINRPPGAVLGCVHVTNGQITERHCGSEPACGECILLNTIKESIDSDHSVHKNEIQMMLAIDGKCVEPVFSVSSEPVIIDGAKFAVVAITDVTDRVKAEKELRETMEIKSQFISTVSHELRTPLASMKEAVLIVLDGVAGPTNKDQDHFLDLARRNIERLWRLINDVLDFQKLGSNNMRFEMQEGDFGAVVEEAYNTMVYFANKCKVSLTLDVDPKLPLCVFDTDRIIQVLTNLMSNAIKFTPEEGQVTVRLRHVDNELMLSVIDTGMGIPPDAIDRIFDRFYRVSRPGKTIKGTGLGLAIVQRLVQAHGGQIEVESELEMGTTFTVSLPVNQEGFGEIMPEATDRILENAVSGD